MYPFSCSRRGSEIDLSDFFPQKLYLIRFLSLKLAALICQYFWNTSHRCTLIQHFLLNTYHRYALIQHFLLARIHNKLILKGIFSEKCAFIFAPADRCNSAVFQFSISKFRGVWKVAGIFLSFRNTFSSRNDLLTFIYLLCFISRPKLYIHWLVKSLSTCQSIQDLEIA